MECHGVVVFCLTFSWLGPANSKEEAILTVLKRNHLVYPVDITFEEASPLAGFPWLKPTDFIRSMGKMNDLGHLLGGVSLADAKNKLIDFWTKYRSIVPKHQLWEHIDNGSKDITKCLPIFIHGDEGTTYKKNGVLILSFQRVIGAGTTKTVGKSCKRKKGFEAKDATIAEGLPLNFVHTGLQTRFVSIVCPKDCGSKKQQVRVAGQF